MFFLALLFCSVFNRICFVLIVDAVWAEGEG